MSTLQIDSFWKRKMNKIWGMTLQFVFWTAHAHGNMCMHIHLYIYRNMDTHSLSWCESLDKRTYECLRKVKSCMSYTKKKSLPSEGWCFSVFQDSQEYKVVHLKYKRQPLGMSKLVYKWMRKKGVPRRKEVFKQNVRHSKLEGTFAINHPPISKKENKAKDIR